VCLDFGQRWVIAAKEENRLPIISILSKLALAIEVVGLKKPIFNYQVPITNN
jgi:hypothetical protein